MDMMNSERFDFLAATVPTKTKDTAIPAVQSGAENGSQSAKNKGQPEAVAPDGSRSDHFAKILAKTSDDAPRSGKIEPDSGASATALIETSAAVIQDTDPTDFVEFVPEGAPTASTTATLATGRDGALVAPNNALAAQPDLTGTKAPLLNGRDLPLPQAEPRNTQTSTPVDTPETAQTVKSATVPDMPRMPTAAGADGAKHAAMPYNTTTPPPAEGALVAKSDTILVTAQASPATDKNALLQQASFVRTPAPQTAVPTESNAWRQGPDVAPSNVESTVLTRAVPVRSESATLAPQVMNESPKTEAAAPKTGPLIRVQTSPAPTGAESFSKPDATQSAQLGSTPETATKPTVDTTELRAAQRSTFQTPTTATSEPGLGRGFSDEAVVRTTTAASLTRSEPPASVVTAASATATTAAQPLTQTVAQAAPNAVASTEPRAVIETTRVDTPTTTGINRSEPVVTAQASAALAATANPATPRSRSDLPSETLAGAAPDEIEATTTKSASRDSIEHNVTQASTTADTNKLPLSVGQNMFSMLAETAEKERLFDAVSFGDIAQLETKSTTAITAMREVMQAAPEMARNIAQQLAQAAQGAADGPLELTLNPEELGKVRMTFATQDGVMTVSLATERPETLELMRRHIESLAQEFREIGFGQVAFDFGQAGDQGFAGDQNDEGAGGNDIIASGQLSDTEDVNAPGGFAPSDGLDIRI